MQNLVKIFGPSVSIFFTTSGGMSLSAVARQQAENKNANDAFNSLVADATAGVYKKVVSFVGSGASESKTLQTVTISPDDLRECFKVGNRNAETAVLMHGVKLWKKYEAQLQTMDLTSFVGTAPKMPILVEPVRPSPAASGVVDNHVASFMELNSIDDMVLRMSAAALSKFKFDFFWNALQLNARAAAIGKLLSEKDSFFRQLLKPTPASSEQLVQSGSVITQWEKSYDWSTTQSFEKLRDELQAEYNKLQQELNGVKKLIKDVVREVTLAAEQNYQKEFGAYQLEFAKYETERKAAVEAYALQVEQLRSSAETLRQQALTELAALQIRVM